MTHDSSGGRPPARRSKGTSRPPESATSDKETPPDPTNAAVADTRFLVGDGRSASALMLFVAAGYRRVLKATRGQPGLAWLTRDHFLFLAVAAAGLPLVMPRVLAMLRYAVDRIVLGMPVAKPALEGWPSMPTIVLPLIAAGLFTCFLGPSARLAALAVCSLLGGFAFGYIDAPSVLVFVGFGAVCFAVIRLPIGRLSAALILCGLSLGLFLVCTHWFHDSGIATIGTFQMTLIPVLWYSAYEHKLPRRPLSFRRFLTYLYVRFFSGPVMTYADMFTPVTGDRLAQIRFAGLKALYVAGAASITSAGAALLLNQVQVSELTGFSLLFMSYVGYVGEYCRIVVAFNVVTGVMRLFGLPVRDNFHYWLLARTPNEHWQRWNLLFREWVITFVFFPIMRAKRWLFVAVMASLLTSGVFHVITSALSGSQAFFPGLMEMAYWTINGLAIYLVIKIPAMFPRLVPALRMQGSLAWSAVGVVATSSFYAVLFGLRRTGESWAEVARFLDRLATIVP